ncbi:MAG: SHOCT domain-containing protein [Gammaproteobacteria bacterium]|nr:SHOCT domain-containing protein [Gammaproteobacteria bacterium]
MRYRHLSVLLALPLVGCSGNPLFSSSRDQFLVDSAPVGASVLVLGETLGQTPLTLRKQDVFPQSFDPAKKHLYGRIELVYPGCEPFIATVSSRVINEGITARLTCDAGTAAEALPALAPVAEPAASEVAQPPAVTPGLKQRLRQLKDLFDEGLISEEEYHSKRSELLQAL